jgi:non-lysosomal glucosylceramidase
MHFLSYFHLSSAACVHWTSVTITETTAIWRFVLCFHLLASHWSAIKQSIEFAWSEHNSDGWDANKDGVLEGRQHHTLDMELFGPSAWLNGFYLAALKAGAEMAEYFGEEEKAKEYLDLFQQGKAWVDQRLFNGSYYIQQIDLRDRTILDKFDSGQSLFHESATAAYWNDEVGEIKYQIGEGCGIDQVVAQ